ncbi:uncharacterized protein LOC121263621 isoform X2 [Juglans microcarpa x Juglans regia]|uniref:uncharacterized protein LOC121263621 isoform X2 n=1 Tax=Juglans microcarpa x Juglans regia TaxID=2249226 RepID=UPI001B7F62FE|nr:uncharacterized protein LOC121263621 isoform X2 [Juglans microcarpa x Juglans regia]
MKTMDLNASTALETLAWSLFRWWRGQLRHHCCRHLDMGLGVPGGPGWGPGPGGPGFGPGPGVFFGGFANGLCSMISSCFYCLCCCWLLQDCFGGPRGPYGPPEKEKGQTFNFAAGHNSTHAQTHKIMQLQIFARMPMTWRAHETCPSFIQH